MCGICGFITRKKVAIEQLKQMNNTMIHRGPDDSGAELFELLDGRLMGLAQRRLSIIDLSPLGHQPMHSKDGRISVVFNGEIYNYRELKKELREYPYSSSCDTEVIIAAYLKWGEMFVQKLNGMFAIALFDRESSTLFLYRDRMGKKPLYYFVGADKEQGEIVFASELKPVMQYPYFEKKINENVLGGFLFHQYICAPNSVFENVYQLQPGNYLTYKDGVMQTKKYWDISEEYHKGIDNMQADYAVAKDVLKELLVDSVKKRMISDVPLGTFLSGGYDSSLVTAIAQTLSDKPVKSFCIGFREKEYNEAKYAGKIAEYLGTDHTDLYISKEDMLSLVESIPQYYDEPFADSSQIPTMLVSQLAKQNVTVVLSGDGGDELFCGYTKYEREPLAQKLDVIGGLIHGVSSLPVINRFDIEDKLPYRWRTIVKNVDKTAKTQYGALNYISTISNMLKNGAGKTGILYDESHFLEKNWQKRAMLLDQETYLPDDILCKVDRASMKYSLEARCPILDHRVVEYSYRIPQQYKYYKGDKKHILKDIAYDYIPKELLERPKKGFSVPIDEWLRGPLKERVSDYSDESFLRNQGIFDPVYTSSYIRDYLQCGDGILGKGLAHSRIVWSFLVFQMWWEQYRCV